MNENLFSIYQAVDTAADRNIPEQYFAVRIVPGYEKTYYFGMDPEKFACLLVSAGESEQVREVMRLKNFEAQFDVQCLINLDQVEIQNDKRFTIIRCLSKDIEIIKYFSSICGILIDHLGVLPTEIQIYRSITYLADIFRKIASPPTRSVNGLFGELYFIFSCSNPSRAIASWRNSSVSSFDFSLDEIRIDIKTSSSRKREHTFSYEQCNPSASVAPVVVSIMTERLSQGLSIADLIDKIEKKIYYDSEQRFRLHNVVTATLGEEFSESLKVSFDEQLAADSMQFYDLRRIPAIREEIPDEVGNVKFSSDLTSVEPYSFEELRSLIAPEFLPEI